MHIKVGRMLNLRNGSNKPNIAIPTPTERIVRLKKIRFSFEMERSACKEQKMADNDIITKSDPPMMHVMVSRITLMKDMLVLIENSLHF